MPNLVMLNKDGDEFEVPEEHFDSALSDGLEPALPYKHKKSGEEVLVRKSLLKNAETEGLVPAAVFDAEQSTPDPKVGVGSAAARGAANAMSLGTVDNLAGVLDAIKGAGSDALKGEFSKAINNLSGRYEAGKRAYQREDDAAWDQNPVSYGAGYAGGTAASMAVPGLNVAKGASMGKAALQAGALGTVGGLGAGTDLGSEATLSSALIGTGLGIAGGALGQKFGGRATDSIRNSAERNANEFAARSVGLAENARATKGVNQLPGGVQQFGADLRKMGVVTPTASKQEILDRVLSAKRAAGKTIGGVTETLDSLGGSPLSYQGVADFLENRVASGLDENIGDEQTANYIRKNIIDRFRTKGDAGKELSFGKLKDEWASLSPKGWQRQVEASGANPDAVRDVVRALREYGTEGAKELGASDGLIALRNQANRDYSVASSAAEAAETMVERDQKNSKLGLMGGLWGSGGATTGATIGASAAGPVGGIVGGAIGAAAGAGSNLIRRNYGNQLMLGANESLEEFLRRNPDALSRLLQRPAIQSTTQIGDTK